MAASSSSSAGGGRGGGEETTALLKGVRSIGCCALDRRGDFRGGRKIS
jgi:hypothetical protein